MNCDSARHFLDAYVDRELDPVSMLNVEEHLTTCDSCSQLRARLEALVSVVAKESPRYRAPDGLRGRIQSELRGSIKLMAPPKKQTRIFDWKWAAIAASVLVSALTLWQMQLYNGQKQETLIAKEIVSNHVRSLMANHLVDEASSDQHNVKPWFAGKLDFSPAVKNLDAKGFTIAGGRLDYLDNRSVAAIVYRRRQHVINLFVWPSSQDTSGSVHSVTVNGFNTVNWRSEGLSYWAVSDLNNQELNQFARLWAQ